MGYILKGRLCGLVCDECDEPLARVGVRLYQPEADDKLAARAVADPKETVAILTDAQAKQRASALARGDDDGRPGRLLGRARREEVQRRPGRGRPLLRDRSAAQA